MSAALMTSSRLLARRVIVPGVLLSAGTLAATAPWQVTESVASCEQRRSVSEESPNKTFISTENIVLPPWLRPPNQKASDAKSGKEESKDGATVVTASSEESEPTEATAGDAAATSRRRRILRTLGRGVSKIFSAIGFLSSSILAIAKDPVKDRIDVPLEALKEFLNKTGIEQELSRSFNQHFATNLLLLARVQQYLPKPEHPLAVRSEESWAEIRQFMRFATAVYGPEMILAAQVQKDIENFVPPEIDETAQQTISKHIGIPEDDLVRLDVDYDGNADHLRHLVAVDRKNKKVILSLRGTFSFHEIVVDVAAFSKPFCGGEAHSEMANMAEKIWAVARPTIIQVLQENPTYQFVITGHSLGAGTACLLNIWLHYHEQQLVRKHKLRCVAFASPPVFAPLDALPRRAMKSATNIIHKGDAVPFLSVHAVRYLLAQLQVIEDYLRDQQHLKNWEIIRMALGIDPIPQALIQAVAKNIELAPRDGAPNLQVPAAQTLWLQPVSTDGDEDDEGQYQAIEEKNFAFPPFFRQRVKSLKSLSSKSSVSMEEITKSMSDGSTTEAIPVHPDLLTDHFPQYYETALDHLINRNAKPSKKDE